MCVKSAKEQQWRRRRQRQRQQHNLRGKLKKNTIHFVNVIAVCFTILSAKCRNSTEFFDCGIWMRRKFYKQKITSQPPKSNPFHMHVANAWVWMRKRDSIETNLMLSYCCLFRFPYRMYVKHSDLTTMKRNEKKGAHICI